MRTDDLIRSLAADLQPVQRLRGVEQRAFLWAGSSLICVFLGTLALGVRADFWSRIRDPADLVRDAVLLLAFVLSARSAFQLSVPGAERSPRGRMLSIGALLLWAGLVAADASGPAHASANGAACLWTVTGLGLVPAFAALRMLRKAAPLNPGWAGSAALLSAASLALLATNLVCARDDRFHVLLWHFLPVIAATLSGFHLGDRFLAGARSAAP